MAIATATVVTITNDNSKFESDCYGVGAWDLKRECSVR